MLTILLTSLAIFSFLFLSGLMIGLFILPKRLLSYAFFLGPWLSLIYLNTSLIFLSLMGLPVKTAGWLVLIPLPILLIQSLKKQKLKQFLKQFSWQIHCIALMGLIVAFSLGILPLLKEGFLTTISLGNNDAVNYVVVGEHLLNHTVLDGGEPELYQLSPGNIPIGSILDVGWRWGTPIIFSFFLNLFRLKAYQLFYLFVVILSAATVPLITVLFNCFSQLKQQKKLIFAAWTTFLFAINVNLLYFVFHGFLAQILLAGLLLTFLILMTDFYSQPPKKLKPLARLTVYELGLSVCLFTLLTTYHEQLVFIIGPLLFFCFIEAFTKKCWWKLLSLIRIGLISACLYPPITLNALLFQIKILSYLYGPIGWQLFRSPNPYPSPIEIIGFWSLHVSPPLLPIVALTGNLIITSIILAGIVTVRKNKLLVAFGAIYGLFLIQFCLIKQNFFSFYRVIGYSIWLWVLLFSFGLIQIKQWLRVPKKLTIMILIGLGLIGIKATTPLQRQMIAGHLTIDYSLISLQELNSNQQIKQPIIMPDALVKDLSTWNHLWRQVFLRNKQVISVSNAQHFSAEIKDGSLALQSKLKPPEFVLNNNVWENNYWQIGQLCISDSCLFSLGEDFLEVNFGTKSENIILVEGWATQESGGRWVEGNQATVRFINHSPVQLLEFKAQSLPPNQNLTILVNETVQANVPLGQHPAENEVLFKHKLSGGIHYLTFQLSRTAQPSQLNPASNDERNLSVRFSKISIK